MKPTQEQIEAALRYADFKEKNDDYEALLSFADSQVYSQTSARILAAAYRKKCEECDRLKAACDKYSEAEILNTAGKQCDFCNELPQTENEKAYYEEFKNMLGALPTMEEWIKSKQLPPHYKN